MSRYKVYYINLEKSVERRRFMEEQFQKLNIPLTRIPAIYGKELDKSILRKEKRKHTILAHFPFPNDGEIGICLTHFKLWKTLSEQPEEFSIILEDDAQIHEDFFTDLSIASLGSFTDLPIASLGSFVNTVSKLIIRLQIMI